MTAMWRDSRPCEVNDVGVELEDDDDDATRSRLLLASHSLWQ
jgi:hypothetical protein